MLIFILGLMPVVAVDHSRKESDVAADGTDASSLKKQKSDKNELKLLHDTFTHKEYVRLLADRVLDKHRFNKVKSKVVAQNRRRSSKKPRASPLRQSKQQAADSGEGDDIDHEGRWSLLVNKHLSQEARRENLKRLYFFLETLGNKTRTTTLTASTRTQSYTSRASSLTRSITPSVSINPTSTVFVLPGEVYKTVEVLSHVFVVNFFTFHGFDSFDSVTFANDLLLTMQTLQNSSAAVNRFSLLKLETIFSDRSAEETVAVMKCVMVNATNFLPRPVNFSVCRDDDSGPKCSYSGADGPSVASCKVPGVLGCSCPATLLQFPPTPKALRDVISLPNESSSNSSNSNSSAETEILEDIGGGADQLVDRTLGGHESWFSRIRYYISSVAESSRANHPSSRRDRRPQYPESLSLQIQTVFLLQYAPNFFPHNVSDVTDVYDELQNLTARALVGEWLAATYFIRGVPLVTPLVFAVPSTPTPAPSVSTLSPIPSPATPIPATPRPQLTVSTPAPTESSAPAEVVVVEKLNPMFYALYALLIFPVALFVYAAYRVVEYLRWREYTKDFSVKPRVGDGSEGGNAGSIDVEVEQSIGHAGWIHDRKSGNSQENESKRWVEMYAAEAFDPIQRNQQKAQAEQMDLTLDKTKTSVDESPNDAAQAEEDAAAVEDPVAGAHARRPITVKEQMRANAAVLACIKVAPLAPAPPATVVTTLSKSQTGLLFAKSTAQAISSKAPSDNNPLDEFAAVLIAGEVRAQSAAAASVTKPVEAAEYSDATGNDDDDEEEDDNDLR
jgi:hypothetical protein